MDRAAALVLLAAVVGCGSSAEAVTPVAPSPPANVDAVARLPAGHPLYFWENHGTGSQYTELRPDGTYRTISREHMGVGESDAGRWRQAADGELLLCSSHEFRHVEATPLWIVVVGRAMRDQLPALRDAIRGHLATHADAGFADEDIEHLLPDDRQRAPSINSEAYGRPVRRGELEALARAIDAYLTGGDENLFRTTPRTYRDVLYLDGSWEVPHDTPTADTLRSVHGEIEARQPLLTLPAIDEATFRDAVRTPQPFVFYPAMNDCPGREPREDVRDAKPERVEARCRSFEGP
jgi:hypothetical protein